MSTGDILPIIPGDTDMVIEEGGKLFVPGIGSLDLGACWGAIDCAPDHADLDTTFFLRHNVSVFVGRLIGNPHSRAPREQSLDKLLCAIRPSCRVRHNYSLDGPEEDSSIIELADIPDKNLARVIGESARRFNASLLAFDLTKQFIRIS